MIKILLLPVSLRSTELTWFDAACMSRTKLILELAGEVADTLHAPSPGLVVVQAAIGDHAQVQECLRREQPDLVHVLSAPQDKTASTHAADPLWELTRDAADQNSDGDVASLFVSLPKTVLAVVLDGCTNRQQATAMAQLIDCVIGTPAGLPSELAAGFLRCFYRHLGRGQPAQVAFAAAQLWLQEQQVETTLRAVLTTKLSTSSETPPQREPVISDPPAFSVPQRQAPNVARGVEVTPGSPPASSTITAPHQQASEPVTPPHTTRYLNAGFYLGHDPVPESEPLWRVHTTYRLAVNLGQPWGPGHKTGLPEQLLAWLFERVSSVELDVVVRSQDLGVSPPVQKIRLPKSGDSQKIFFAITLQHEGRHNLSIDLLYQGHLLQSRRIEFTVAAAPGLPAAEGLIQEQAGYVTFTRTADLGTKSLTPLKDHPRQLTIIAERDPHSATIGLRFYDQSQTELAYQDSRLSEISLTKCLEALRNQLARVMTAYAGPARGTPQLLGRSLGALADLGRRFYRALLPGLTETPEPDSDPAEIALLRTALVAGSVVQVAPLSSQLSVPWELLYERPIETYREDRIHLCADFTRHGSAATDCPHYNDPQIVCPHGFWGYRYIIEQLPCRVDRSATTWTTLPLQILYNCGAAGVLGTQCEVRELLAGEFMMRFLGDFLRQVPAGQALLQARTALLHENDPRGLAYSLFAAADVKLGQPVL